MVLAGKAHLNPYNEHMDQNGVDSSFTTVVYSCSQNCAVLSYDVDTTTAMNTLNVAIKHICG